VALRVALTGFYWHSAHWVLGGTLLGHTSTMAFMLMASMAAMNHMRAAAEAHHEVEEHCKK
jgi:hypothetical protein